MKPLNLSDAMKLGTVLYPYIPDSADDGFEFIGTIISNINKRRLQPTLMFV